MRKQTKELALSGMMAALGTVIMCLGGIIPIALYACPILASAVLLPVREDCRRAYGWCCYAAIAGLSVVLCPDKEAALVFAFLGYYPLVKPGIDRLKRPVLRLLTKVAVAAVSMGAMYWLAIFVLQLASVVEELKTQAAWMLWVTVGMGLVVFLVYDVLLGRFAILYRRRRKK